MCNQTDPAPRTVTFFTDTDALHAFYEHTDVIQARTAVGYLTAWNLSYPHVNIYHDGKTDLVANFLRADGTIGYTIGAVWNGEAFGFHS